MSVARDFALSEIDSAKLPDWPSVLRGKRITPPKDMRDLALAEQIRVGVIKNLLWLQTLIEHHSGRGREKIDVLVQKILAIGLFQLRSLERVPARAALDEAVEQARRFGRSRAAGFVNAVLRNATRADDPDDVPEHIRLSHPAQLFQRLLRTFDGDEEAALALCRRHNDEPPLIVRLGQRRTIDDLRAAAAASNIEVNVAPHEREGMFVIERGVPRSLLAAWSRQGIAQPQDPTSAAIVPDFCDAQPGKTVLDRCCGVGTKTLQLWEAVVANGGGGRVFAIDPNEARCETLRALLAERGIDSVGVIQAGWLAAAAEALPKEFDRVLVDVPCGNSGVLIRRPEARYHQSAGAMRALATLQHKILADTARFVRRGGKLIYATCSLWPEENERIVDSFLNERDNFTRLEQKPTIPTTTADPATHHDGGFVAILERK